MVPGAARVTAAAAPAWALPSAASAQLSAQGTDATAEHREHSPHSAGNRHDDLKQFFMVNTTAFMYLFNVTVVAGLM